MRTFAPCCSAILICLATLMLWGCSYFEPVPTSSTPKSHMGFASKSIKANGLTFHYVEKGKGPIILFLHGFPHFSESWYKLMHHFGDDHHVVAPDSRGYGFSDKPKDVAAYRMDKLVSDVMTQITKLSPNRKIILVGHDWGAAQAWAIAQLYPELISKLIVINGAPLNVSLQVLKQSEQQRQQSRYINDLDSWYMKWQFALQGSGLFWREMAPLYEAGHVNEQFHQAYINAWQQPGAAQAAVNWYTANIPKFDDIQEQHMWPGKNTRVSVPSLVIWSKHDAAVSNDLLQALPAFVDDISIKVIDTHSNVPFIDHADEVIHYMRAFIES